MNGVNELHPASGGHVAAAFQRMDQHDVWDQNWAEGESVVQWEVLGTTTTIQGVLCCIDLDTSKHWLLMLVDTGGSVSYFGTSFHRERWPWFWVHADSNHQAIALFVDQVALAVDMKEITKAQFSNHPLSLKKETP